MPSHVGGSSTKGKTLEYSLSRYAQHVCTLIGISHFNAGGPVCVMVGTNLCSLEILEYSSVLQGIPNIRFNGGQSGTEMIQKDLAKRIPPVS